MDSIKFERIIWVIFFLWFCLRSILLCCQYVGDTNPATVESVISFFPKKDIELGKEYALWGFWFKSFYGLLFVSAMMFMLKYGFWQNIFERISSWCGTRFYINEIAFLICFFSIIKLISFPQSVYLGYYRELKMGFSSMAFYSWFVYYAKMFIVNVLIECFVVASVFAVVRIFPNKWNCVLPASLGTIGFVGMFLMPLIITPLFYDMARLPEGKLKTDLLKIAELGKLNVNEIYVINESKYSEHTNAYFTGIGDFKRIVLYDNLLKKHSPEEIELIFAHEAGHWKHNHMFWGLFLTICGIFATATIFKLCMPYIAQISWISAQNAGDIRILPFVYFMFILFSLICAPIENQISQRMEKQADQYSLEITGHKQAYIDAQIKLAKTNRADLLPNKFRVWWLYSHPTAIERILMAVGDNKGN